MRTAILSILCALMLGGCASQKYARQKLDGTGKLVETCKAESTSWLRLTEAETLNAAISCTDDRDTTFGATNLSSKSDTEALKAIAEGVAQGAVKAAIPGPTP